MANSGEWGDAITLQAFANRFDVSVLVLSSLGVDATTMVSPWGKEFDQKRPYLIVGHKSELHYFSASIDDKSILDNILAKFTNTQKQTRKN